MTGDGTVEAWDLTADLARLESLRRNLGAHLAMYRMAAGVSQPELGQAIGRTRSMVSKIEHGRRGMPATLWTIADDVCRAQGALVAEYSTLADAEQDYRASCRVRGRQVQQRAAQAEAQAALSAWPAPSRGLNPVSGLDVWPDVTLVSSELAEEFMAVVTRLVRSLGRRDAMRLAGSVLAAVGLSGLDADESTRLTQAVAFPSRVDAQVINNLAVMLAICKRQEDKLGPREVLDTVIAQHGLVRRLLVEGDCPERLRKSLHLVDSNLACTIGGYLIDMGHPDTASRYFGHARRAGHHAGNATCATYAAINTSFAAFQRRDTPTALDTAAAARSLAARTDDPRLKALAEEQAAGAYALDGQHKPCMTACDRAHDFLANANECVPDSPAYWVHEGTLNSKSSTFLSLLGKPREALEAAGNAQARFNRSYVGLYARCQVRLGHALVLSNDITKPHVFSATWPIKLTYPHDSQQNCTPLAPSCNPGKTPTPSKNSTPN